MTAATSSSQASRPGSGRGPAPLPGPEQVEQGPGAGSRAEGLRREAAGVRVVGDRLGVALWAVAGSALLFTMANVTGFATAHGTPWQIAWLLDPMASLALLVVLVGDGVLARHGVRGGGWARAVKLGAGTATWSMNVWASVAGRDVAGVVLHSVAPALVIGLAEATPTYRARFAALAAQLDAQAAALEPALAPTQPLATPADTVAADPGTPDPGTPDPAMADRTAADQVVPDSPVADRVVVFDRPVADRGDRRTEGELEELVRAAIAAGDLPPAPSGTAIQRRLGGGKSPAIRVAARLAAQAVPTADGGPADAVAVASTAGPGLVRMAVAS